MIVAITVVVFTVLGASIKLEGAAPKEHIIVAPLQTHIAINNTSICLN